MHINEINIDHPFFSSFKRGTLEQGKDGPTFDMNFIQLRNYILHHGCEICTVDVY